MWKYYESSTKIIIFKLILVGFKQNLRSGYLDFILGVKKKIIYNSFFSQVKGSFEPLGLIVAPPMVFTHLIWIMNHILNIVNMIHYNMRGRNTYLLYGTTKIFYNYTTPKRMHNISNLGRGHINWSPLNIREINFWSSHSK